MFCKYREVGFSYQPSEKRSVAGKAKPAVTVCTKWPAVTQRVSDDELAPMAWTT